MKQSVGRRHRDVRETILKLSVSLYAQTMNVKDVTVYSWESGRTSVPQDVLAKLERENGISAGWMLTGQGEMMVGTSANSPLSSPLDVLETHLRSMRVLLKDLRETSPEVMASAPRRKPPTTVRIPMLSLGVSAGAPVESADTIEGEIDLGEMLLEHPESTYFIRVVGDSMTGAGIMDGDTLIVDCSLTPKSGQIVIARVYGELTVKRYITKGGEAVLRAENKRFKDITIDEAMDFTIVGVVRSCIKQF
ncbi:MAG: translesion error-prone DNA polymerase V autoproteolytic subunit [bacterium]|nr:translesion error-prone DNA polymerase V autoproteolytic subunit [bacterium]